MFITHFPIIFLQIKVSRWHLFPWQRRRYSTLLPSTFNLSRYENSSCLFFSPVSHTSASVRPLKPVTGRFLFWETQKWSVVDGRLSFAPFSSRSVSLLPPIVSLNGLPGRFHSWCRLLPRGIKKMHRWHEQTPCLLDFVSSEFKGRRAGAKKKREEKESTSIKWWSMKGVNNVYGFQNSISKVCGAGRKKRKRLHRTEYIFDRWHGFFLCNWFALPFVSPLFFIFSGA